MPLRHALIRGPRLALSPVIPVKPLADFDMSSPAGAPGSRNLPVVSRADRSARGHAHHYPAACRPRAWSAAAAVTAIEALRATA